MLTMEEATTKFKSLLANLDTLSPEKREAVLRLQTALQKVAAEEKARTQLPLAASLLKEAEEKEAAAKSTLDGKLVDLQQRKDAAFSKIETENAVLVMNAQADYAKVAAQLQQASTHYDESKRAYELAIEEARKHPISETDRG